MNTLRQLFAAALLTLTASAEIIGVEQFDYPDGPIAGQTGGTFWDFGNTAAPVHDGTPSVWRDIAGAPTVAAGRLVTDNNSAVRPHNGPSTGFGVGSDEEKGSVTDSRLQQVVYYRVTFSTGATLPDFLGVTTFDFGDERIFFGKRPGQSVFGIQTFNGFGLADSGVTVAANTTYMLVAKVDYPANRISLFINPNLGSFEPAAAVVINGYTSNNFSTGLRLGSASGGAVVWDNLIAATNWADLGTVVTTLDDEDDGGLDPELGSSGAVSLREAVKYAPPGTFITFFPSLSGGTITLGSELALPASGNLTIDATALPGGITLSGNDANRHFFVEAGRTLTLRGLTLTRGNRAGGVGGSLVTTGTLRIFRCTVTGNTGTIGGALVCALTGVLECEDSTISDNVASSVGGGLYLSGGTVKLNRCTLSGNIAEDGAALMLSGADATLLNCTVAGNRTTGGSNTGNLAAEFGNLSIEFCTVSQNIGSGGGGSGVYLQSPATVHVHSSILAENAALGTSLGGPDIHNNGGTLTTSGASLIGSNESVEMEFPASPSPGTPALGSYVGTAAAPLNPNISPLGFFGGPVMTMHPLIGSLAIDNAGPADPADPSATDARGFPGVVDGDSASAGAQLDIGAVEAGPLITVTTPIDELNIFGAGAGLSLRETFITNAVANPGARIGFDPGLAGQTITLGGTQLAIPATRGIFIDGSNLTTPIIISVDNNNACRVFHIPATATVAMHSLEIANGNSGNGDGGGILNEGTFSVFFTTVRDHIGGSADSGGGGMANYGTSVVHSSTFSGNRSPAGAGIYNTGICSVISSTFSENRAFFISGGGGGIWNSGTCEVKSSTFSGNTAIDLSNESGFGGGIRNFGVCRVLSSTLSGNSAFVGGGGINNFGTCIVNSSTLSGNSAGVEGGGIFNDITGTCQLATTIVAGNFSDNIVGSYTGSTNLIGGNPLLSPLANNGGPTQTMALLPGSPAINAATASTRAADQRGFPIVGVADIGAFEFSPTVPTAPDGTATATTGDQITIAIPAFDTDGDTLTIIATEQSPGITVNSTEGNEITFTADLNRTGAASLLYTVSDGTNSASGTIFVTITDNDAPSIRAVFRPRFLFEGTLQDFRSSIIDAQDNVGTPTVTQFPLPGSVLTVNNVLPITFTATDGAGNTAQTAFIVTVRPLAPFHTTRNIIAGANTPLAPGAGTNGLPADAKLVSFGPPAISDDGSVAFIGKWKSATRSGSGVFLDTRCLAVTGPIFKRFTDPVVDGSTLVTIATFTTGGSAVMRGFFSLEVVARTGDIAPEVNSTVPLVGPRFKAFKSVITKGGSVAFLAQTTAPATRDIGVWLKIQNDPLTLALTEGQSVGIKTIKTLIALKPTKDSPGQGRGTLGGSVRALAIFTDKTQGIVSSFSSSPFSFAFTTTGGSASVTQAGLKFATYGIPAFNGRQESAFLATLQLGSGGVTKANARGIFLGDPQANFEPLVRIGENTDFFGGKFSTLGDPVISENGNVAFLATQKGGTVKGLRTKTLWWKAEDQPLALLGLGGNPPPDLPNAQWKSFSSLAISDRGPIFAATLVPGKGGVTAATASGVWACDFQGQPRTLFRLGDMINGKKLARFTLLKVTVGNAGVSRSFNNDAQVVWLANFTDKSSAIVVTEVP